MRLKEKVCVITGAGSGMGRAIAELFAREGAHVVGGDIQAKGLDDTAAAVQAAGGQMICVLGNVAHRSDAERLVDSAKERLGRIDVLVNCAGVVDLMQGVDALTDDVWERVMGVNLNGPMYTTRRAVQLMLEQGAGGSIVNIGSTASERGAAAGAAYTASKHALLGLSRNTAWMYAEKAIRCNVLLPGGTATAIVANLDVTKLDPHGAARIAKMHAMMPVLMQADDMAKLALFLASDESQRINGAAIAADGGWLAS